jgi:hypothetical protein
MVRSPYYNRQGEPIHDLFEWARLFEDRDYKVVQQTTINPPDGGRYFISTVWMGVDHSWGSGPPVIFETMVFIDEPGAEDHSSLDHYMDRYSTEAEAIAGHRNVVGMVQATLGLSAVKLEEEETK